jgi:site-specific recombinase XerC
MSREAVAVACTSQNKLVSVADIRRMLDACDNTLTGIRDRALIAFAFSAGSRLRADVASTAVESLERLVDEQGRTQFRFTLRRSHTESGQPIDGSVKPIFGIAANYLDAWLKAFNIREGALWRRIQMRRATTPLSPTSIFDIVSKRASKAGLLNVNPRSLRAGFVTAAPERADVQHNGDVGAQIGS